MRGPVAVAFALVVGFAAGCASRTCPCRDAGGGFASPPPAAPEGKYRDAEEREFIENFPAWEEEFRRAGGGKSR